MAHTQDRMTQRTAHVVRTVWILPEELCVYAEGVLNELGRSSPRRKQRSETPLFAAPVQLTVESHYLQLPPHSLTAIFPV